MPAFGTSSLKRFKTLHPYLQLVMQHAIEYWDFTIVCGFRDEGAQNDAYNRGASKVKWPNSKHNTNPSIAVDIAPWDPVKKAIDWNDRERFVLLAGFVMGVGITLGIPLRWGGDWDSDTFIKDHTFQDLGHFELMQ